MKLQTIKSSKIIWTINQGSSYCDFVESYCADGDGLIAIHKRLSGVYAIFADISPDPLGIFATLEEALAKGEALLLEHYPEVYEDAMHWEDSPTCDYCKIELEVTNPQGVSKRFICDLDTQKVFVGISGKPTSILCPWLSDFEASYVALDAFTGHIGTFEIVHYCFVEGCIASETIEDDDDNVLASYQILVDGKPTTYEEIQALKAQS